MAALFPISRVQLTADGLLHITPEGDASRSGAIEIPVKRIVDPGVKGNPTYWLREDSETMIRLQARIKTGRGEELCRQATYGAGDIAACNRKKKANPS
jgi:hypothetical protein